MSWRKRSSFIILGICLGVVCFVAGYQTAMRKAASSMQKSMERAAHSQATLSRVRQHEPGAVLLEFDKPIQINAASVPVKYRDQDLSVVRIGAGVFRLGRDFALTGRLSASVAPCESGNYLICARVFDARGAMLGAASQEVPVELEIVSGVTVTDFPDIQLDFGRSKDFSRAAFLAVSIDRQSSASPTAT